MLACDNELQEIVEDLQEIEEDYQENVDRDSVVELSWRRGTME